MVNSTLPRSHLRGFLCISYLFTQQTATLRGAAVKDCGKTGIRTLGTKMVQRFSRPPRSATPASFHRLCGKVIANFITLGVF